MIARKGGRYLFLHQAFGADTPAPTSFPHVQAVGAERSLFEGFGGIVSYERGQSPYDGAYDFVQHWRYASSAQRIGEDVEVDDLPPYVSMIAELFPPPALPSVPTLPGLTDDGAPRSHFWGGVALVALGLYLLSPRS